MDTRLMKNFLSLRFPEAQFLCSSINEADTEGDIRQMGARLSQEIKAYIKEWFPNNTLHKLSFIGHSLGGIIIRTALPYLDDFKEKMFTYLSLSSPHLGCMFQNSKIVETGMWFMKKFKSSLCLRTTSIVR